MFQFADPSKVDSLISWLRGDADTLNKDDHANTAMDSTDDIQIVNTFNKAKDNENEAVDENENNTDTIKTIKTKRRKMYNKSKNKPFQLKSTFFRYKDKKPMAMKTKLKVKRCRFCDKLLTYTNLSRHIKTVHKGVSENADQVSEQSKLNFQHITPNSDKIVSKTSANMRVAGLETSILQNEVRSQTTSSYQEDQSIQNQNGSSVTKDDNSISKNSSSDFNKDSDRSIVFSQKINH